MKTVLKNLLLSGVVAGISCLLFACTHTVKPVATSDSNIDWPSYGLNLESQRFSSLTQINQHNVAQLQAAWSVETGIKATFQATPIVVNGIMYISLPFNHVMALDAATGKQLWKYTHTRKPEWNMCCGPANRGVAVAAGKVFIGTVDARLIALDAASGKKLWDIDVAGSQVNTEHQDALNGSDPNKTRKVTGGTGVGIAMAPVTGGTGVGIAMAPVVYRNKVIIGITGVGYGLHIDNPRSDAMAAPGSWRRLISTMVTRFGSLIPFRNRVGKDSLQRKQPMVVNSIGIFHQKRLP